MSAPPVAFADMRLAFAHHARAEGLDLDEHPLHALYLNKETQGAWRAWKAAYVALGHYVPGWPPQPATPAPTPPTAGVTTESEVARLAARDAFAGVARRHVTWGPEAANLTEEERAAILNAVQDQIDAQDAERVEVPTAQMRLIYDELRKISQMGQGTMEEWLAMPDAEAAVRRQAGGIASMAALLAASYLTPRARKPDDVSGIPHDLRQALLGWWRAHHHGTRREEREAEEALCAAITPRTETLRAAVHGPKASRTAVDAERPAAPLVQNENAAGIATAP